MRPQSTLFYLFLFTLVPFSATIPVLLDFEGIGAYSEVGHFYNGKNEATNYGVDFVAGIGVGTSGGPSLLVFSTDFVGTVKKPVVNVDMGFTSLSFSYSSSSNFSLQIFDGVNATGSVIQVVNIQANLNSSDVVLCGTTPGLCQFDLFVAGFNGVAKSIDFSLAQDLIAFDDLFLELEVEPGVIPAFSNLTVLGIDGGFPNLLYSLSPTSPSSPIFALRVKGLDSTKNEQLLAIAQQRTTGIIYGISNLNFLYQLDPFKAQAYFAAVISCHIVFSNPTLHASFHPKTGNLHVVTLLTENGNNFEIDTNTGSCISSSIISYPNLEFPLYPAGAAFDTNATMFLLNSLPNNYFGSVNFEKKEFQAIGPLGLQISGVGGFDIVPDYPNYGFAALYIQNERKSSIFRVDLISGETQKISDLSFTSNLLSFAAIEQVSISSDRVYEEKTRPISIPSSFIKLPSSSIIDLQTIPTSDTFDFTNTETKAPSGETEVPSGSFALRINLGFLLVAIIFSLNL